MTTASHSLTNCGVRSGINFHLIWWDVQNPAIARVDFSSCRSSTCISLSAPMKFVSWPLQIVDGIPRRPINLRKVAIKADVVRFDTSLRCTAFVARHKNIATYPFVKRGLRTGLYLTNVGPA